MTIATLTGSLAPASAADDVFGAAPPLSISPGAFAFGPINVGGELGEPGEFTLSNPGPGPVSLDDAIIDGTGIGSFHILPNGSTCYFLEAGVIPAGSSCTVVTIFDPASEGAKQATLRITSDSVTSPDELPLTGTGLPRLLPGATLSPGSADFGNQLSGTRSAQRTFTLTSSGTGDLDVGTLSVAGADPEQFEVTSTNCQNRVMASGDSCQIQAVFTPDATGSRNATFTIATDANGADTTVELSGTGTGPVPPPVTGKSRVRIGSGLPPLRRSNFQAVPIRCFTTNMDFCRGRVTLWARGRALGLRHNRLVGIGSQSFSLRPGEHSVQIGIGDRARSQVRRRERVQVRVIATSRQGNGDSISVNVGRSLRG